MFIFTAFSADQKIEGASENNNQLILQGLYLGR